MPGETVLYKKANQQITPPPRKVAELHHQICCPPLSCNSTASELSRCWVASFARRKQTDGPDVKHSSWKFGKLPWRKEFSKIGKWFEQMEKQTRWTHTHTQTQVTVCGTGWCSSGNEGTVAKATAMRTSQLWAPRSCLKSLIGWETETAERKAHLQCTRNLCRW